MTADEAIIVLREELTPEDTEKLAKELSETYKVALNTFYAPQRGNTKVIELNFSNLIEAIVKTSLSYLAANTNRDRAVQRLWLTQDYIIELGKIKSKYISDLKLAIMGVGEQK